MATDFGWHYPAGMEHDPRAPWNQRDENDDEAHGRHCKCRDCQDERADHAYERWKDSRLGRDA